MWTLLGATLLRMRLNSKALARSQVIVLHSGSIRHNHHHTSFEAYSDITDVDPIAQHLLCQLGSDSNITKKI